jgi:hypothetical protein
VDGSNLVANREFFLGSRKFVEAHPEVIEALINLIPKAVEVREAIISPQ